MPDYRFFIILFLNRILCIFFIDCLMGLVLRIWAIVLPESFSYLCPSYWIQDGVIVFPMSAGKEKIARNCLVSTINDKTCFLQVIPVSVIFRKILPLVYFFSFAFSFLPPFDSLLFLFLASFHFRCSILPLPWGVVILSRPFSEVLRELGRLYASI